MFHQTTDHRSIIVASLAGPTLDSLTLENLIWPTARRSVLDYLGIKEEIMNIPQTIKSVSKSRNYRNVVYFYLFVIVLNLIIWLIDMSNDIRIPITGFSLFFMICTCCRVLGPKSQNSQDDIIRVIVNEFNAKCKLYSRD